MALESFSRRARRIVSLATVEAQQLDHPQVGTEHLLLGLLSDDAGTSAEVLRNAGASLAAARHKVAEVGVGSAGTTVAREIPFTARAKRAIERAGRFSRQARLPEVTPEDLLLGVLDVEGLGCQVLRGLSVDLVRLRHAVVATRDHEAPMVEVDDERPLAPAERVRPRCPWCEAALDGALAEAPMTPHGAAGPVADVSVIFCGECGATLGILRPNDS